MALKPDERIDESTATCCSVRPRPLFRTELLLSRDITSRTYSFYYPRTRPEARPRCLIVSSTNANYDDWAEPQRRGVRGEQARPDRNDARRARQIRARTSASGSTTSKPSTPRDVRALHAAPATAPASARSSKAWPSAGPLPQQIAGLYHAGSVGIIMSGWLGAMNYGVIVANESTRC